MLSDTAVKNAKPKRGEDGKPKPDKLSDGNGMYLYVTEKGSKSFRFDYAFHGVRKTLAYGLYPALGLKQARAEHAKAKELLASGQCPANAKKRAKQAARVASGNTFEAVAEDWFGALAPHRSKTWRENTRRWLSQRVYPSLRTRPVTAIEAADVLQLTKAVAADHPKSAADIQRMVSRIFQHAVQTLRAKYNPARECAGAIIVPPPVHHKPLPAGDVYGFTELVDRYPGRIQTKLAMRLLLLTAVRKDEMTGARWDELDLEAALWRIPAARMKGKLEHLVPLSQQALQAFTQLKPLACGSIYVFPNIGDLKKPMAGTSINRAFAAMGVTTVPHGLRSSFSTWANENNFHPDHIERSLAHVERNRIRGSYNSALYIDQRRVLLQAWADFCDRPPNVSSLDDARRARKAEGQSA